MVNDKTRKRPLPSDEGDINPKKKKGLDGSPESDETVDDTVYLEDIESTGESAFEIKRKQKERGKEQDATVISSSNATDGYDSTLLKRIAAFSTYEKPSTYTYAFDKLPLDREWGLSRPFDDKSTMMCKTATNEPYIIWIVGRVSRTWFFDKESNPATQVSINIVPINDPTGPAVRRLLSDLSKPVISSTEDGWGDLRATKWQNSRNSGSDGTIKPFMACYDARVLFRAKKDMGIYPVSDLKPKDLVLLEASIARYRIQQDTSNGPGSKSKARYQAWDTWRAHLELRSISVLSKVTVTKTDGDEGDTSEVAI